MMPVTTALYFLIVLSVSSEGDVDLEYNEQMSVNNEKLLFYSLEIHFECLLFARHFARYKSL